MMRFTTSLTSLTISLLVGLLALPGNLIQAPDTSMATPIDMATVPVPATAYFEDGFQLLQAGYVDSPGLQSLLGRGEPVDADAWEPIGDHLERGYTTIQGLLSDRGDAYSAPLAAVNTVILAVDDDEVTTDVEAASLEVLDAADTDEIDGIGVYEDQQGIVGSATSGQYVVIVHYDFAAQANATRQNTDWTGEVIAGLVQETIDRLEEAVADADSGEPTIGLANLLITGPQAGWSQPWANYPTTQHYRVLDGEVTPYGGELRSDLDDRVPDGVEDLFVSRQVFDDDRYGYVIDVTLATFGTEAEAAAFTEAPVGVSFPTTWSIEPAYGERSAIEGGGTIERARVDGETLQATGYRTIDQTGTTVQVVQFLASGDGRVSRQAAAGFASLQARCVAALPDPCQPVAQDDLGIALDESGPNESPAATPSLGGDNTLASAQFGWSVALPDDGWSITSVELERNGEYFELQSGRSIISVESAIDHHGDPQECVLGNAALLEELEERAVIDLGTDDPDERKAGLETGHGWAVYTVEPLQEERADQEYVIRIDCYTLVEGEASLVVTHRAPRELWTTEREKGNRFREAIVLPETMLRITLPEGDGWDTGRTLAMGIPRIWISRTA